MVNEQQLTQEPRKVPTEETTDKPLEKEKKVQGEFDQESQEREKVTQTPIEKGSKRKKKLAEFVPKGRETKTIKKQNTKKPKKQFQKKARKINKRKGN